LIVVIWTKQEPQLAKRMGYFGSNTLERNRKQEWQPCLLKSFDISYSAHQYLPCSETRYPWNNSSNPRN
jgi:hypothetical protein